MFGQLSVADQHHQLMLEQQRMRQQQGIAGLIGGFPAAPHMIVDPLPRNKITIEKDMKIVDELQNEVDEWLKDTV